MELTRRDATAALAAIGATGGVAIGAQRVRKEKRNSARSAEETPDDEEIKAILVAVAEVVYPEAVSGTDEFVSEFLDGRLAGGAHATGMRKTVDELDELARDWYGSRVVELTLDDRERLLGAIGADTADEDPTGTTAERVRYYVVNELLLALYASPTGGDLVGVENPQGHPGGVESYSRGPQ